MNMEQFRRKLKDIIDEQALELARRQSRDNRSQDRRQAYRKIARARAVKFIAEWVPGSTQDHRGNPRRRSAREFNEAANAAVRTLATGTMKEASPQTPRAQARYDAYQKARNQVIDLARQARPKPPDTAGQ